MGNRKVTVAPKSKSKSEAGPGTGTLQKSKPEAKVSKLSKLAVTASTASLSHHKFKKSKKTTTETVATTATTTSTTIATSETKSKSKTKTSAVAAAATIASKRSRRSSDRSSHDPDDEDIGGGEEDDHDAQNDDNHIKQQQEQNSSHHQHHDDDNEEDDEEEDDDEFIIKGPAVIVKPMIEKVKMIDEDDDEDDNDEPIEVSTRSTRDQAVGLLRSKKMEELQNREEKLAKEAARQAKGRERNLQKTEKAKLSLSEDIFAEAERLQKLNQTLKVEAQSKRGTHTRSFESNDGDDEDRLRKSKKRKQVDGSMISGFSVVALAATQSNLLSHKPASKSALAFERTSKLGKSVPRQSAVLNMTRAREGPAAIFRRRS